MNEDLILKLKEISNDLHDLELNIFKDSINNKGNFVNKSEEILFNETCKTRKHLNQLIYLLERN